MLRFSESVLGQDLAVLEVGSGLDYPTLKPLVSFSSRYKARSSHVKGKGKATNKWA